MNQSRMLGTLTEAGGVRKTMTQPSTAADLQFAMDRVWFTGHQQDEDSGLVYAGARHYDPVVGRFLSVDPASGDPTNQFTFNRYAYGNNNPYRYVDPDGRETTFIGGAGVNGTYIQDMAGRLTAAGIKNVKAADPGAASFGGSLLDAALITKWNQDLGTDFYARYADSVRPNLPVGEQLNLIGYSHGSVVAAQTALALAAGGQHVDNVVLIGAPVNPDLLDALKRSKNIGSVHILNLTDKGDPIHAGMSDAEIVKSLPTLIKQQSKGEGHFYYAPATQAGNERRSDLARSIKDRGLE